MPPKRKLAEDTSDKATRSTRSSTRAKVTAPKDDADQNVSAKPATKRATKKVVSTDLGDDDDGLQPKKKLKKTTSKGRKPPITNGTARNDDESGATAQTPADDDDQKVKQSKSSSTTHVEPPPSSEPAGTSKRLIPASKEEPYSPRRALSLFETYADPDEPNVIGPEGFEKLCADAGLKMEGVVPLILAWQMEAQEMAKISKEEWIKGTGALRISSLQQFSVALTDLESLLIHNKPLINKPTKEPYNRTKYWTYTSDVKDAFRKLYTYCFALVKPASSKNIEMETAVAFWSVLLAPKYPLMEEILEYINEKGTYRAANKDLWNMMLEFCETVNPNLDNYEAEGAWPTLLDEFASWKKAKSTT